MAKWSLEQWSWDEGKIRKALEGFRTYLKSDEGKRQIEDHERWKKRAQEFLKDGTTINGLTNEQLDELLRDTYAFRGNHFAVREIQQGNNDYITKVKDWLKRLISYEDQGPLPTVKNLGVGYASELLTMRFPERFYLINNASKKGMECLGQGSLPSLADYSQWRPLFEGLLERINEVVQQELGRPANFYDVDMFLWYVASHFSDTTNAHEPIQDTPLLVRYFEAKGFRFTKEQVAAFYAALKTKGFVILSGLSGTGKTKLAQLFAELLCPKCSEGKQDHECTHLFLSVRPDWRDSKALLGYYNPLTERYESTPLLEFLLRAARDYEQNGSNAQPYFVILDEMNLAHVEYYFTDFLSVLESGRDGDGWTKEALRLHSFSQLLRDQDENEIPPTLPLPPNLYIVGTVNIDETTYMFSPKVLDRAFTLEFREVDFSNYPPEQTGENWTVEGTEEIRIAILEDLSNGGKFCAVVADKDEVKEALQNLGNKKAELVELNGILQPYDLHFGYRVLDEIALFVQNAKNAPDVVGKLGDDEALDYAMLMKVLPKFHGPRQKLEKPLREVLKWAAKETVPDWANWVKDTSKPLVLDQVTEALTQWERLEATQQQAQQEAGQGADRQAEQPANAQQGQDNQTETTPDQATQGEANDQSGTSTKQPFKDHFRYPNTAKKVLQMLRQLYETGFASFAQ